MKVLISTSSFGEFDQRPLKMLKEADFSIQLNPHARILSESEIKELLKEVDLLLAGTEPLTSEVLRSAQNLKVISRCGAGLENVDLKEAKKLGIKVFNTPFGPTRAVAELTIGLVIDLLRLITPMDQSLRKGIWQKQMGSLLQNKKIGIIGFGRIGQEVAKLLLSFEVEIAYYDVLKIDCSLAAKPLALEELLFWADIVTLHLSGATGRKPMIGEKELQLMRQGSWLINTARGGAVDEEALYRALKDKRLAGAALDVFQREPYQGHLRELENVVLTPHVGSYAKEARIAMEIQAVENLLKGLPHEILK